MIEVQFKRLDERAIVPRNAYGNDAGWDLFALEDTPIVYDPDKPVTDIRTGIAIALPEGYFARIVHRSSSPRKRGIMIVEGVIDAGFRGELFAGAVGLVEWPPGVRAGESVAQLIVQEVRPVSFVEVDDLPQSLRGEKGFGSSDVK